MIKYFFQKLDALHEEFKRWQCLKRILIFPVCFFISLILAPYWCWMGLNGRWEKTSNSYQLNLSGQ